MTTPVEMLISQAEALVDTQSHREAWRAALAICLTRSVNDVDGDRGAYWQHEIAAFDRTFYALESLAQAAAQPVEYLEIDWRTDGHDCTALSVFDSIEAEYRTTCGKPAPDVEMATTIRRVRHRLLDWFGHYRKEIRAALQPVEEQAPRAGEYSYTVAGWLSSNGTFYGWPEAAAKDRTAKPVYTRHEARSRQPEQVSEQAPVDERAAFEAWARTEGFDLSKYGDTIHNYMEPLTDGAWIGWQARSSQKAAGGEPFAYAYRRHEPEVGPGALYLVKRDPRPLLNADVAPVIEFHKLYTSPQPLPADWVMVPREPTEEMDLAGMEASVLGRPSVDDEAYVRSIYRAMLATLPPPPHTSKGGE